MHNAIEIAEKLGAALKARKLLLTVAESCTGGAICQAITEVAGASEWFDCGYITYSNASKTELLDISDSLIAQYGAVSEEIAAAMARGALANCESHIALSTTGIAGPSGAVPGKPVGTICFGWVVGGVTHTERLVFAGDRHAVREQTVLHSLNRLLRYVEEI
jgi:nicotinamide-nucleotide amidase